VSTPAGIPVTLPTVTSNLRAGGETGQAGAARSVVGRVGERERCASEDVSEKRSM